MIDLEMTGTAAPVHCDMTKDCTQAVTHLDEKGYVYCATHGQSRRGSGIRCRKMTAKELRQIQRGETLRSY